MGANRKQDLCSFMNPKKEAFDNPSPFSSASEKLFTDAKKENSSNEAASSNPKTLLKSGFFWHCTDCGLAGKNGTICEGFFFHFFQEFVVFSHKFHVACARNCHLRHGHNVQFGGFGKFFCVCGLDEQKQKNPCIFLSKDGRDPKKLGEELLASEQQALVDASFQQIFEDLQTEMEMKSKEFEKKTRAKEQEIMKLKNEYVNNEQKMKSLNEEADKLKDRLMCVSLWILFLFFLVFLVFKKISNNFLLVCMDNDVNVFTEPCGHVCLCRACADTNDLKQCPVCNTQIAAIHNAYLP